MTKRNKRFFRMLKMDLIRLAIYLLIAFLAVLAVCFVLSIPEIIGSLFW